MKNLNKSKLKRIAKIDISGIDKKTSPNEKKVKLCNFTDVYYNWSIFHDMSKNFMEATANQNEIDKFTLKKGMIAITKDSETRDDIGISCLIEDDLDNVLLGYHNALLVPDEKVIDSSFLNAYLKSPTARKYFSYQASGSGQRYTLTSNGIESVSIYYPSLEKQIKIGNYFSLISKKIFNNNVINDNLSYSLMIA